MLITTIICFFINRHEDIFFAVISIRDFNIVGGLDR